jgi:hypothetical protein
MSPVLGRLRSGGAPMLDIIFGDSCSYWIEFSLKT